MKVFVKIYSKEELEIAIKSIPKDSSPRPNGFGSRFYIACWDFIKEDLLKAAKELVKLLRFFFFLTIYFGVLISKLKDLTSFEKIRRISLCSVAYKMFSKIIVGRLIQYLNRIISPEQGGFLPSISIFENITLVQEIVHSINRKDNGGNVVLKVDMAKAYDLVDQKFLMQIMEILDFLIKPVS